MHSRKYVLSVFRGVALYTTMLVVYCAACIPLAVDAFAQHAAASGTAVMPRGFETIYIGMKQKELIKARPGKLGQGFEGDNTKYPKVLVEKSGGLFFDSILYGFSDDDAKLISMVFIKKVYGSGDASVINRFKRAVVNKWGSPDNIVIDGQGVVETPALIWNKSNVRIIATYPFEVESSFPGKPANKPGALVVKITPITMKLKDVIHPVKAGKVLNADAVNADLKSSVLGNKSTNEVYE